MAPYVATCQHAEFNNLTKKCGAPAYSKSFHGWLCIAHYRKQQHHIPNRPRKPSPRWIGLTKLVMTDEQLLADIIRTDKHKLSTGKIQRVRFGCIEPVYLRYHIKPELALGQVIAGYVPEVRTL